MSQVATSQSQSIFFAAQEHIGVVMMICGLMFTLILYLILQREKTKRYFSERESSLREEAAKNTEKARVEAAAKAELIQNDKLSRLETMVEKQSASMESVALDIKSVVSTLEHELKIISETVHKRITELSREFYTLQGEHHHNMKICPALQSLQERPNPGRRAYDPAQFAGNAMGEAAVKYGLSKKGREGNLDDG